MPSLLKLLMCRFWTSLNAMQCIDNLCNAMHWFYVQCRWCRLSWSCWCVSRFQPCTAFTWADPVRQSRRWGEFFVVVAEFVQQQCDFFHVSFCDYTASTWAHELIQSGRVTGGREYFCVTKSVQQHCQQGCEQCCNTCFFHVTFYDFGPVLLLPDRIQSGSVFSGGIIFCCRICSTTLWTRLWTTLWISLWTTLWYLCLPCNFVWFFPCTAFTWTDPVRQCHQWGKSFCDTLSPILCDSCLFFLGRYTSVYISVYMVRLR